MASSGNFPFVAQIQINGKHWCSGFIYNYDWIVTTASCVNGYDANIIIEYCDNITSAVNVYRYQNKPETITVVVGQVSLSTADPDEESIIASAVIIHENYDSSTRFNDIAMIQVIPSISQR